MSGFSSSSSPAEAERVAAVTELVEIEREYGRVPIVLGPFSAYLIAGALRSAVRAPGLVESTRRIGSEVAESALAGLDEQARAAADALDAVYDELGPDADPTASPAYLEHIARLQELESGGGNPGTILLGAYSSFVVVGLLQLITRHPSFPPGSFGHEVVVGFARQLQAPFSPTVRALIEEGFDPDNDVDRDGRPLTGR